jgi:ABC-type branched-subunit amino acid transport system substrate-binding protein
MNPQKKLWFKGDVVSSQSLKRRRAMRRSLVLSVLVVGMLLAFSTPAFSADVSKGIKVGNAGAFTGDAAAPCMEIYNSAQIAIDEWNEKGGIKGVKIQQVMGDDAMDPAQGVNVANKFVADSLIYGVVGPPMSHIAQATMKIYGAGLQALLPCECQKRRPRLELRAFHSERAQSQESRRAQ